MTETKEKRSEFPGTYFDRDSVLRLAAFSRTFAWVVLVVYILQWLLSAVVMLLQILRGFWAGMGLTDVASSIMYLFESPLRGAVYFVVLQGVAQALLMFMDMEDNTRRAARESEQESG